MNLDLNEIHYLLYSQTELWSLMRKKSNIRNIAIYSCVSYKTNEKNWTAVKENISPAIFLDVIIYNNTLFLA